MRLIFLFTVLFLFSCSSVDKREVVKADHETGMNIPEIDSLIVSLKRDYVELCYMPVLKREASNSPRPCETSLNQMLERRYNMDYTQEHVDMAADDLFFADVRERLVKKLRADPKLKKAVGKRFKTVSEAMDYYKSKYTFKQ